MDQRQALGAQVGQPQLVNPAGQHKLCQTIEKTCLLQRRSVPYSNNCTRRAAP